MDPRRHRGATAMRLMEMRRGFTLIELMVVVGLMALLGSISVMAWGTVAREVSDRSAREALQGFLQEGVGTSEAESTRVVLRFRNHVIAKDEDHDEMKVCRAQAIKPIGRVSKIEEGVPWDEFADEGPVRLDGEVPALPLSGDVAAWKVGDPYGRAVAELELPQGYWVEEGEVSIVPAEDGKAQVNGSVALKATRLDGSVEQVGDAVTVDSKERAK